MATNIVIPMAGEGSRFSRVGYKKPKPFKFKRGRWLKNGTIQHMRVTASGRRYWTPKLIKIDKSFKNKARNTFFSNCNYF